MLRQSRKRKRNRTIATKGAVNNTADVPPDIQTINGTEPSTNRDNSHDTSTSTTTSTSYYPPPLLTSTPEPVDTLADLPLPPPPIVTTINNSTATIGSNHRAVNKTKKAKVSNTKSVVRAVDSALTSLGHGSSTTIDGNEDPAIATSGLTTINTTTSTIGNNRSQSLLVSPKRKKVNRSIPNRSVSPARFYREREQSELQSLNDHLSSHLETMKHLQSENASLKLQIQGMEVFRFQTETRKQLHNSDIETLQELLDNSRQENTKLEQTLQYARKERDSLSQSLTEREEDVNLLEIQVDSLRSVSQQFDKQQTEFKTLRECLQESEEDAKRLSAELVKEKVGKKRLEEEIEMNKGRYMKEIEEASKRMSQHLDCTDKKLEAGYEELVSEALTSVREQNVRDLAALKEELTAVYQSKLSEWKGKSERASTDLQCIKKELKTSRGEADTLRTQMTRVKMDAAALRVQIEEDQARYFKLKSDSEKEACHLQREMVILRQELCENKEELEKMSCADMRLQQEITNYRALLEDLEAKSPFNKPTKAAHSSTDNNSNANRLDMDLSPHIPPLADTYLRTNQLDHGIRIESVDTEGRYMVIANKTDHLVDMCLWTVRQSSLANTVTYEIPYSTPLLANQRLFLWSNGEGPFVDKPGSEEILSLPDDQETRQFYRVVTVADRGEEGDKHVSDAIHITMPEKSWLKRPHTMNMRLEDGDSQLQSKSDFTIHKLLEHSDKDNNKMNTITTATAAAKPSSSSHRPQLLSLHGGGHRPNASRVDRTTIKDRVRTRRSVTPSITRNFGAGCRDLADNVGVRASSSAAVVGGTNNKSVGTRGDEDDVFCDVRGGGSRSGSRTDMGGGGGGGNRSRFKDFNVGRLGKDVDHDDRMMLQKDGCHVM